MVTFTDEFDRSSRDLANDGGWETIVRDTEAKTGAIEILREYATNSVTVESIAAQTGATAIPTTANQQVTGWVSSTTYSTGSNDQYVDLGVGMSDNPEDNSYTGIGFGYFVRLDYRSAGQRVLSIMEHFVGSADAPTTLASLTMIAAGTSSDGTGVVQTGYVGHLDGFGAVNIPQEIRLIVDEQTSGLRLRAYVNNPDDDKPTLEARSLGDYVPSTAGATYGYQWFRFGPANIANTLILGRFYGEDYTHPISKKVLRHPDWPTLQEVRRQVRLRHTRGATGSLTDSDLDQHICWAHDELINDLGDIAHFLVRSEGALTITFDSEGFATLPVYMRRVQSVERTPGRGEIIWQHDHFVDTSGAIVIRNSQRSEVATGGTFRVKYLVRHERPGDELDQLAWPRSHTEVLVVSTLLRLAEDDRSQEWYQALMGRFQKLHSRLFRDMNRHTDLERRSILPRSYARGGIRADRHRGWTF